LDSTQASLSAPNLGRIYPRYFFFEFSRAFGLEPCPSSGQEYLSDFVSIDILSHFLRARE
jgi:hypothetical protein